MLCSISTGKSNSRWLDRLRSSKGFPTGTDVDLETFLTRQHPDSSDSKLAESTTDNIVPQSQTDYSQAREIVDQKQPPEIPRQNGDKEWYGVMSNVLAELFYMGDSKDISRINGKKSSRKQQNPKICVVSKSSNSGDVVLTVPSTDGHSRVETKGKSERRNLTEQDHAVNVAPFDREEEEKFPADLSGFSRTEVTVIDTSCPSWKFDKMLYRRKNVWKARDKKGKPMNIGRKKRKLSPLKENHGAEKKAMLSIGQCSSSKEANGEGSNMPLNAEHNQSNKMDESDQDTHRKRFPRKLKKGNTSVVLIKNIPTSKKKICIVGHKKLDEH